MRHLACIILLLTLTLTQISAQEISFQSTLIDLGTLKQSEGNKDFEFKLTNTGDSPLVLLSVDVSCDCTDIEFSKRPINAGESSTIKITYKPAKQLGSFYKAVKINANTESKRHIVSFKGEVIK